MDKEREETKKDIQRNCLVLERLCKHQWKPQDIQRRPESQWAAWKARLALEVPLNFQNEENLKDLLRSWEQNDESPWYATHGQVFSSITDCQQEGTARKLKIKYLYPIHSCAELCPWQCSNLHFRPCIMGSWRWLFWLLISAEKFSVYISWEKPSSSTLWI